VQPVHGDPAILRAWPALLGAHRCGRAFAYREFADGGAPLALGSDAPTAPHAPLANAYVATTRRSAREPGERDLAPVNPHFALGLCEAVAAATRGAAYSTFAEGRCGSLEKGKLADLQVTPPERKADVIDWPAQRQAEQEQAQPANIKTGTVKSIFAPGDAVIELKQTKAGQANVLSAKEEIRGEGRLAIDGNINNKYFNSGQDADGFNPRAFNTGLQITPHGDHAPVTPAQFATANDMPDRDPLKVSVEGSDDPNGGNFVLLYQGSTGLEKVTGRGQWGPVATFDNTKTFKLYRILVTETRGDNADAVQFAELRLGSFLAGAENK